VSVVILTSLSVIFTSLVDVRNNVCAAQYKPRPNPKDWKQIEQTELYKNDNILRDYQLEGLNWLTFSYYNRYVFCFLKYLLSLV